MILIYGGMLVTPRASFYGDVLIEGETIARILRSGDADRGMRPKRETVCKELGIDPETTRVVDATGKLLFPGFIDTRLCYGEKKPALSAEEIRKISAGALLGGTTTWLAEEEVETLCDRACHPFLSEEEGHRAEDLPGECTSVALTMAGERGLSDDVLYEWLLTIKDRGAIAQCHCENGSVIRALEKEYAAEKDPIRRHGLVHPPLLEAEAIGRYLYLAQLADAAVIVGHLSSAAGLAEVRAAKQRGQTVYVETSLPYLTMTRSVYDLPADEAADYLCDPPLRSRYDAEVLWKALQDEEVQTVCTGRWPADSRLIAGRDERAHLLYAEGVAKGRISRETMCAVLSENAAKLYGLYPRKGVLAEGADADLVLFSPETAAVEEVFLRGRLAAKDGECATHEPGRLLSRVRFRPLTKIKDVLYS